MNAQSEVRKAAWGKLADQHLFARKVEIQFGLRISTFRLKHHSEVRASRWPLMLLVCWLVSFTPAFAADTEYKLLHIERTADAVRVRLPLTDVTGKVRPKLRTEDGNGEALAPTKVALGAKHFLEWQISYDTRDATAPNVVREIEFTRRGETKFGAELSKMLVEALRAGVIVTNDLLRERDRLAKLLEVTLEEREGTTVEKAPLELTGSALPDGFTRWTQKTPQFLRETEHGWIQIQMKPRQRAVGSQAMVYVCLPLDRVLAADGSLRPPGPAKSKETVQYDFTRARAGFLLDIVRAFAIASRQHNEDMGQILGKILGQPAQGRGGPE